MLGYDLPWQHCRIQELVEMGAGKHSRWLRHLAEMVQGGGQQADTIGRERALPELIDDHERAVRGFADHACNLSNAQGGSPSAWGACLSLSYPSEL